MEATKRSLSRRPLLSELDAHDVIVGSRAAQQHLDGSTFTQVRNARRRPPMKYPCSSLHSLGLQKVDERKRVECSEKNLVTLRLRQQADIKIIDNLLGAIPKFPSVIGNKKP